MRVKLSRKSMGRGGGGGAGEVVVVQESAHATRGLLCAQPDANVLENVKSSQFLLQHNWELTP